MNLSLEAKIAAGAAGVEEVLDALLPLAGAPPVPLTDAMRYAVLDGGKRLRPFLVGAAAEAAGGEGTGSEILQAASALELIHAYSLVHDDLPCMDDSPLRRGKPSVHAAFGEAMALLAGDALLPLAFQILAQAGEGDRVRRAVAELAWAAGWEGLVGGQSRDLLAEGREVSSEEVEDIHRGKTGALWVAAARIGGLLGGADEGRLADLTAYARSFGILFQITDDLLDLTGDAVVLGKPAGADVARKKATFPALLGLDGARRLAMKVAEEATAALADWSDVADTLRELVAFILKRTR